MKMNLSFEQLMLMLSQADTPKVFQDQVTYTLNLCKDPRCYNIINSLKKLYLSERNLKHYRSVSEKVLHDAFSVACQVFPGPVGAYGRDKSYLSYLLKLLETDDVTTVYDHSAHRIILDDTAVGAETGIGYLYQSLMALYDYFFEEGFIVKELRYAHETISDEIRQQVYVPKKIPEYLKSYDGIYKAGIHTAFFKDRVRYPKANGFRGLTLVVLSPEGLPFEIQLWTTSMAEINDFGSANHDVIYKPKSELDELLEQKGNEFMMLKKPHIHSSLVRDTVCQKFPEHLLKHAG